MKIKCLQGKFGDRMNRLQRVSLTDWYFNHSFESHQYILLTCIYSKLTSRNWLCIDPLSHILRRPSLKTFLFILFDLIVKF